MAEDFAFDDALVLADLQWRRNDLVPWNSMTTSNVTVESKSSFSGNGSSFSNSIWLRVLLNWATDPAATYSTKIGAFRLPGCAGR